MSRISPNKITISLCLCMLISLFNSIQSVYASDTSVGQKVKTHLIQIRVDNQVVIGKLDDTETVRDFIALLPITVELADYAATEKITYLPRKLLTRNTPEGIAPEIGDIAYYAPWGNIAIFYQRFHYSSGLIRLGKITQGIEHLKFKSAKQVTIVLFQEN
ncbi:cyclophilin-like fold protein [Providencia sp.]|uniref:cyclophilin-like fold protein n=1 Tax=Providencia sp. TaxID=589 RepID=UPI003F9B3D6C